MPQNLGEEEEARASGDLKSLLALAVLLFLGGSMAILLGARSLRGSRNGTRECSSCASKSGDPDPCEYCKIHHPTKLRYCEANENYEAFCDGRRKAFQRDKR